MQLLRMLGISNFEEAQENCNFAVQQNIIFLSLPWTLYTSRYLILHLLYFRYWQVFCHSLNINLITTHCLFCQNPFCFTSLLINVLWCLSNFRCGNWHHNKQKCWSKNTEYLYHSRWMNTKLLNCTWLQRKVAKNQR